MPNGYSEALRNKMLRETELFLGRRLRPRRRMIELPSADANVRSHYKSQSISDNAAATLICRRS